jgi:hypothetical protein
MCIFQTITLLLSLLAILASIISIFINASLKHDVDVKLTQYNLTNEEQNRILKNLFDLEDYWEELLAKYTVQPEQLLAKISPEEKLKTNKFISEINFGLSKVFIVMPDDKYITIDTNWKLESNTLNKMRSSITILMRQTQHPKTRFGKKEDIKLIHKI